MVRLFNQDLHAAHYDFTDLHLTPAGTASGLKLSVRHNGKQFYLAGSLIRRG
ncbi:MAG: hypothetical protein ACRD04_03845 [Terriglobales bacterium]